MDNFSQLSAIGLGTWQFSSGVGNLGSFWPALDQQVMRDVVDASVRNGVNWFDTAEKYGDGASERNLARALKDLNVGTEEVFIADKWWPKKRKATSLIETIDERLSCLDGYPIGLYQIHWPESESWLRTEMKYLAQLVERGKVKHVGLCNYNWRQVRRAHRLLAKRGVKLASVQVRYGLLCRSIEQNNLLRIAEDLDIKLIAWSPLESGLLSGKFHDDETLLAKVAESRRNMYGFSDHRLAATKELIAVLREIAERLGAAPAQVALRWITMAHDGRVMPIPGATSAVQAEENAKAMDLELSQDDFECLDALSLEVAR